MFSRLFPAGRELSKLAIAWQAAAYGSDPAVFTPELMASVTDTFLEQKVLHVSVERFAKCLFMCHQGEIYVVGVLLMLRLRSCCHH